MARRLFCMVVTLVAVLASELPAQDPAPEVTARAKFNQVFVKVIVPVTPRTPEQKGPAVESWVAVELKKMGELEYFAVTDWVPVCDGLLADEIVDNDVWDGRLRGNHGFCPVGGDIPKRKDGRMWVCVTGWTPVGGEANIELPDEPGSRAVGPVRLDDDKQGRRSKIEEGLPYVAVIVGPPPRAALTARADGEKAIEKADPEKK